MAISFVTSSVNAYVTATNQNATIPASAQVDDLLMAIVFTRSALTPPTGWTLVDSQDCSTPTTTQLLYIYMRTAEVGDPGAVTNWAQAVSNLMSVEIQVFRAAAGNTFSLVNTAKSAINNTSHNAFPLAVLSTTAANQLLVAAATTIVAGGSGQQDLSSPAGWTQTTTPNTPDNRLVAAYRLPVHPFTVSGNFTAGFASTNNGSASITALIREVGPFDPLNLGPSAWYDPSDLSTLWQDTAGTIPVTTHGQSVARIDDKSGNARHLTQATLAAQPTYGTDGSRHWLDFDGVDDRLVGSVISNYITNSLYECCLGFRADTVVSNAAQSYNNESLWGETDAYASTFFRSTGVIGAYNWDGTEDTTTVPYTIGNDGVVLQRHSGGQLQIALDSTSYGAGVASANTQIMTGIFRLGTRADSGVLYMDGRVYGAFFVKTALADTDRTDLYDYMRVKVDGPTGGTITNVTPNTGTITGGTPVTITGSGFTGATGVLFDAAAATSVVVVSNTEITCETPSHATGAVNVTVQHSGGDIVGTGAFTYIASVDSVVPNFGLDTGGTAVTINGVGFTSATGVLFDTDAATSVVIVNDTEITCETPAHANGSVDVTVQHPLGDIVGVGAFTYSDIPQPTFISIEPISGTKAGGTPVTITGTNLTSVTGVLFDGVPATSFVVVNDTEITCVTPAHAFGLVDVTLSSPGGDDVEPDAFEFLTISRVTQVPLNIVIQQTEAARVTQVPINVVYLPPKPGRATQIPLNVVFPLDPTPPEALLPVWPIEERWQWLTTVVKAFSGKEQRMSLREDPFLRFSYDLPLRDDEERQTAFYTFHRFIGKRLNYPLFMYGTTLLSTAAVGSQELVVDLSSSNFRAGEPVAVFNVDLSFYQLLQTDGFNSPDGILLTLPLEVQLDEGLMVAPAPLCRIADGQEFGMGVTLGNTAVTFAAIPARTVLRPNQTAGLDAFDGMPLLPQRYVNPDDLPTRLNYNLQTADTGLSEPVDHRTWRSPQIATTRIYKIDREDMDYWRQFAYEVRGSRLPFLIPSYRLDFLLNAVPILGSSVLTTADNYVADYFKYQTNRYLRIVTANGVIYRRVRYARLEMDRTVSIFLTTALGMSAGDNQISMVSIANKVRISDDLMLFRHYPNYSEVSFNVVTVNQ